MAMQGTDHVRLESERRFHNERFADETRKSVQPFYQAAESCFEDYRQRINRYADNARVLEYGCATGKKTAELAARCHSIDGIDISDVAIEKARALAERAGVANACFTVMDAENLEFDGQSFELIFGSGIIHHLDLDRSYRELARVLRPEGVALFAEPLGHNPLINRFRSKTPSLRTPDEHPLKRSDLRRAKKYFASVKVDMYGLSTLAAIPLIRSGLQRPVIATGGVIDRAILQVPGLRWWAWYSLIELRQPLR